MARHDAARHSTAHCEAAAAANRVSTGHVESQQLQLEEQFKKYKALQEEVSMVKNWCLWLEKTVAAMVKRNDKIDNAMSKCLAICDKPL